MLMLYRNCQTIHRKWNKQQRSLGQIEYTYLTSFSIIKSRKEQMVRYISLQRNIIPAPLVNINTFRKIPKTRLLVIMMTN